MKLNNNSIHYCTQCHEDEDESIATHYCNDCNKHLCEGHLIIHNKKKQNKDHHLTNLLSEEQQEEEEEKEEGKEEEESYLPNQTIPTSTNNNNNNNFNNDEEEKLNFSGGTTSTCPNDNNSSTTTTIHEVKSSRELPPNIQRMLDEQRKKMEQIFESRTLKYEDVKNNMFNEKKSVKYEDNTKLLFNDEQLNNEQILVEKKHYCKVHKELETDIYCFDCDEEVCSKCALFKHKLHEVIDSSEIVKEEEQKMKQLFEDLKSKKEVLLQRTANVKLTITKVNEQANLVKNDINELFIELQQLLNEKKEKLTLELDEIVKDKLNTLQNEEKVLNEYNNVVNDLCQLKVDNLNKINILQNKIKFEKKDNDLNELIVIDNLEFMSNFKLRNVKQDFINLINNNLDNLDNFKISVDKLLFKNKEQVNNDFNLIKFEEITKFEGNENLKLNRPLDIIYNNNLIYIADTLNKRVLILDNLFNYKNEIKLFNPYSLTLNNKYLFVGCIDSIFKYDLNTLQLINEIKSNENDEFNIIYGMALDKDNNFICNQDNNEIIIFNENNEFIRKFKTNNNLEPRRIIINNKDQIVITCKNEIQVFDKLGNFILNIKFNDYDLNGIICDDLNNYIVCDRLQLLLLDNNFNLLKEIKKNFNSPIGITLDKTNNQIYVLNFMNGSINFFK